MYLVWGGRNFPKDLAQVAAFPLIKPRDDKSIWPNGICCMRHIDHICQTYLAVSRAEAKNDADKCSRDSLRRLRLKPLITWKSLKNRVFDKSDGDAGRGLHVGEYCWRFATQIVIKPREVCKIGKISQNDPSHMWFMKVQGILREIGKDVICPVGVRKWPVCTRSLWYWWGQDLWRYPPQN